jgi:RNA polymerase subunit RPABC4/transcription elongation factor Spt4
MKHCYHCGRITAGDPLFCNSCGRTFDRKLCPRLHPNPRSAEICSRCGSRELSSPQPKVSAGWQVLEWLTRTVLGAFLVFLAVFLVYAFLKGALGTPGVLDGLILLGCLVAVLTWMWSKVPEWFRKFIQKQLRRKKDRHDKE